MTQNRICPRCGSKNISPDLSVIAIVTDNASNDWICNNCGYKGMFFPVVEKMPPVKE